MTGVVLSVAHGLSLDRPTYQFFAKVAAGIATYPGAVLAGNRVTGGDLWLVIETVRRAFG